MKLRKPSRTEGRLRAASLLVAVGLLVALASMLWNHPLSFMLFLFVGMPICAVGTIVYLLAIVRESAVAYAEVSPTASKQKSP